MMAANIIAKFQEIQEKKWLLFEKIPIKYNTDWWLINFSSSNGQEHNIFDCRFKWTAC